MVSSHLAQLKIDDDMPPHQQTIIMSQKLLLEEELNDLAYTISTLKQDLCQLRNDNRNAPKLNTSMCETENDILSAEQGLEEALTAFDKLKMSGDSQTLTKDNAIQNMEPFNFFETTEQLEAQVENKSIAEKGMEPFNLHIGRVWGHLQHVFSILFEKTITFLIKNQI